MSHPRALELARRLRDHGGAENLASAIENAAASYRCPICSYAGGDPLVGLLSGVVHPIRFACPICSPPFVRAAYGLETPQA